MVIPFTLLLGALGYLYYKSKEDLTIVEKDSIDSNIKKFDAEDLYKDIEDLFI